MQASGSMRAQIGTLIVATSGVQLANGFFGTFFSLRVALESFEPTMAGLVLSSYFAGFTIAAMRCGHIIERIGHIRVYAACAGLVVAATVAMPLLVGPLPWLLLRAVTGFGCAGLFITTESWLNAKAAPSERGRVFSFYMLGTFAALALGQVLISHARIETAAPFNAVTILFAVALVMVSMTRAEPPQASAAVTLPYSQLLREAPVAVAGSALSGLISSAFYSLVPAWMQGEGIELATIGLFMLVAVLGVSNSCRPALGPGGPAHLAGRARCRFCDHGNRYCASSAYQVGRLAGCGVAWRLHVGSLPRLRRQCT
jgi:MFS family permease